MEVVIPHGDTFLCERNPFGYIIYLRDGVVKLHMEGPGNYDQTLKLAKAGAYIEI